MTARVLKVSLLILALLCIGWGPMMLSTKPAGGMTCMAGTYLFAWDGQDPTDNQDACDGSNERQEGSTTGSLQIGTDYGEGSPDVGIKADDTDEYLSWVDGSGEFIDHDGARTIWLRIYLSAVPDQDFVAFRAAYDASNYIQIRTDKAETKWRGQYVSSGESDGEYCDVNWTTGSWVDIAYTFQDAGSSGVHSFNCDGSWDTGADSIDSALDGDVTSLKLGDLDADVGDTEYIQITKYAILTGYQTAVPW